MCEILRLTCAPPTPEYSFTVLVSGDARGSSLLLEDSTNEHHGSQGQGKTRVYLECDSGLTVSALKAYPESHPE